MYGIVGEDDSDVNTLEVLVRALATNRSIHIETRGFGGCGEMLRKGASQLRLFQTMRCTRFIVCHDADDRDPEHTREMVRQRVVRPSGIKRDYCVLVPVKELEAWILADIECATKLFPSWRPSAIDNPENIPHPKEYLEKLSRDSKKRPRYHHAIHNQQMAKHLDVAKVHRKCPSFRVLTAFVKGEAATN